MRMNYEQAKEFVLGVYPNASLYIWPKSERNTAEKYRIITNEPDNRLLGYGWPASPKDAWLDAKVQIENDLVETLSL